VTGWLRASWSRLVAGLAITTVAAVTGVVSYIHIEHLTLELHQPALIAHMMPVGVDGLIVAGSVVLLQPAKGHRWLGWIGVGPGVVISLFANAESALRFGWLSAAWAAVPAFSFSVATFILERWLAGQARKPADTVLTQVALDAEQAAQAALRATTAAGNPLSGRQLADRFGLNRAQVASVRGTVLAESDGHGEVNGGSS